MNPRPLLVLAAIAAATSPDMGKGALDRFKGGVRDGFARDPMGSVLAAVLGGAWLFYKAERGHNPKVKSYYDALVYVSTNLSVGYSRHLREDAARQGDRHRADDVRPGDGGEDLRRPDGRPARRSRRCAARRRRRRPRPRATSRRTSSIASIASSPCSRRTATRAAPRSLATA